MIPSIIHLIRLRPTPLSLLFVAIQRDLTPNTRLLIYLEHGEKVEGGGERGGWTGNGPFKASLFLMRFAPREG